MAKQKVQTQGDGGEPPVNIATATAGGDHEYDPVLTPEEVGRRIGKTGQTIRNWIRDGLLEFVRMPSGLKGVKTSQVNAILAASSIQRQV